MTSSINRIRNIYINNITIISKNKINCKTKKKTKDILENENITAEQ